MRFADRISWQQTLRREHEWQERLLESGHRAYELSDEWTGLRMIGDVTWSQGIVESVGVVHGDPTSSSAAPTIHVHTTTVTDDLGGSIAARAGLQPRVDPLRGPLPHRELPPLGGVVVTVDGEVVPATRGISAEAGWLVEAHTEQATVYVEGHGVDRDVALHTYELRHVDDFEPLFGARLELLRRLRE